MRRRIHTHEQRTTAGRPGCCVTCGAPVFEYDVISAGGEVVKTIVEAPTPVLGRIARAVRDAWALETSVDPDGWTPGNPAWGQCAVTALLVQDLLGGDLLRAAVQGTSHYWNRLPDGTEVDLTFEQFDDGARPVGEMRSRRYVLSFPATATRYEKLRAAFERLQAMSARS